MIHGVGCPPALLLEEDVMHGGAGRWEQPAMTMPCPAERRHNTQSPGPNSGMRGKIARVIFFHPATRLFSCLVFLGAAQAFLFQLLAAIRAKTKPGAVSVPGTGDLESQAAAGRGKSCGMAWLWPLASIYLLSFAALGSRCPTMIVPKPLETLARALFTLISSFSGCDG